MTTLNEKVNEFLNQRRIAVAGLSRTKEDASRLIYRKLKSAGYQVFGVNPNTEVFEGDPVFADLASIPGGVDGVVIVTNPVLTEHIVRQAAAAGVKRVWMHQSMMKTGSSVSEAAVEFCEANGLTVIDGGCPMMFCEPVDFGHKCMRGWLQWTGGLPA